MHKREQLALQECLHIKQLNEGLNGNSQLMGEARQRVYHEKYEKHLLHAVEFELNIRSALEKLQFLRTNMKHLTHD